MAKVYDVIVTNPDGTEYTWGTYKSKREADNEIVTQRAMSEAEGTTAPPMRVEEREE